MDLGQWIVLGGLGCGVVPVLDAHFTVGDGRTFAPVI
jgi:hypothetical protein